MRLHRCGEYEIERNGERLGLTICARADSASGVRAEVTAMRATCGRVRVGDTVVAVDGRPVKAMASAADVQEALKTAARLRMRTPRVLSPRMAHRRSMPATASTAVVSNSHFSNLKLVGGGIGTPASLVCHLGHVENGIREYRGLYLLLLKHLFLLETNVSQSQTHF